jgi:hypothetical protein
MKAMANPLSIQRPSWATEFRGEIIDKNAPEDKPWGTYEFAVADPDETLVRVGWPSHLRKSFPNEGV